MAYDALWTDTKIYVETILPQPICIPTEFNGEVQIYMGARFSTSDFGDGAVDAVRAVGDLLAGLFPAGGENPNELPDRPVLLT